MTTSKSPLKVAAAALAAGKAALPDYSHRFSPRRYTQPRLFACLVLMRFFKADYRGIWHILRDSSDLRRQLGLDRVPHYTTLQKAADRLLSKPRTDRLLAATLAMVLGRRRRGRPRVARAAADSSGLDAGHASRYYVKRRSKGQDRSEKPVQSTTYQRYCKLEAVFDCKTHLVLAVAAGLGPRPDTDRLSGLLDQAAMHVSLGVILADAGYDSEPNHRHARQAHGIRSYIPATAGRPSKKPPTGRYRRLMRKRLRTKARRRKCGYTQRWQAETGVSMIKRRLAAHVAARSYPRQVREMRLLALSHNLLLAANL